MAINSDWRNISRWPKAGPDVAAIDLRVVMVWMLCGFSSKMVYIAIPVTLIFLAAKIFKVKPETLARFFRSRNILAYRRKDGAPIWRQK